MLSESLDQIEKEVDVTHYLNVENIRSCPSAFRYFEGEKNPSKQLDKSSQPSLKNKIPRMLSLHNSKYIQDTENFL